MDYDEAGRNGARTKNEVSGPPLVPGGIIHSRGWDSTVKERYVYLYGFALFVLLWIGGTAIPSSLEAESLSGPELPYGRGDTSGLASLKGRSIEQDVYRPGEFLKLRVTYLGLTAGYLEVRVDTASIEGRDLYTLNMEAYTAGAGGLIYTVRDRFVSYVDQEGLFSWGYDFIKQHEDESEETRVRYYHGREFFTENGTREGSIPPYTQDLLSAVYYIRTQELADGQEYQFPIHSSSRAYRLTIRVEDSEPVATREGWKDAYRLIPTFERKTDRDEAFEHVKEVRGVKIWISKSKHRIPLKISVPATFGQVYAYYSEFRPGNQDS
jgi:hypothetical protein